MTRYRMMTVLRPNAPKQEVFRFFKTLTTNIMNDGGVICRFQNMGITDSPQMIRKRGGEIITHVQHYFFEFYAAPKTVLDMKQLFRNNDLILRSMIEKVKERALYSPMPKTKEIDLDYDIFTQYGDKLLKNDTTKDMIIQYKFKNQDDSKLLQQFSSDSNENKLSDQNL